MDPDFNVIEIVPNYQSGSKSLIELVNSLFVTVNLYDVDNINKIVDTINTDLESVEYSLEERSFINYIAFCLTLWKNKISIINDESPHYSTSIIIPYRSKLFLPLFNMLERICSSGRISKASAITGKSYLSNVYRAVINNDLSIFAYLVQPAIYNIANVMENPNIFTCDKIERVISVFMENKEIMLDLTKVRDCLNTGKICDQEEFKKTSSSFISKLQATTYFKLPHIGWEELFLAGASTIFVIWMLYLIHQFF